MRRALLLVLLVCTIALPVVGSLAVPANGAPPPESLCSVCGETFAESAADHGVSLSVERATLTVTVTPDGDSHWVARNRLASGSDLRDLRSDGTLSRVATDAIRYPFRARPDPAAVTNVTSRLDGDTVVVEFDVTNVAQEERGLLFVDYFRETGRRGLYVPVDRLELVGPEGYTVTSAPSRATTEANRIAWTDPEETDIYGESDASIPIDASYVAFGPEDDAFAWMTTRVVVATQTAPTVLTNLALLLPAIALFVGGVAAFGRVGSAFARPRRARVLAGVVLVLGVLGLLYAVGSGVVVVGGVPFGLAAGCAGFATASGLALWAMQGNRNVSRWWTFAPPLVVSLFFAVVVALPGDASGLAVTRANVVGALALSLLFPLGYAVARDDRRTAALVAVFVLGAGVAFVAPLAGFTRPQYASVLTTVFFAVFALGGLLFGFPLYLLGESTARLAGGETGAK